LVFVSPNSWASFFFDLDTEIEQFFEMSIEQLHQKYWMPHDFRKEASKALSIILDKPESQQAVIALPIRSKYTSHSLGLTHLSILLTTLSYKSAR